MHVGKSAYSGHYMAQIKNFETNEWFSFNDESIHKIKKKQQLGCTEDEIEKQKTKAQQQAIDNEASSENASTQGTPSKANETLKNIKSFSTSNAYLLVYYRKDLIASSSFSKKSESEVQKSKSNEIVEKDNKELEEWFEKLKASKIDERETQNSERTIVRSIYDSLWCSVANERKYFVNTEFIRKLLLNQTNSITNVSDMTSKYLCSHKRMNPFAINKFKLISKEGLECIIDNYGYKANEIGVFEASDNEKTRCFQCVCNIFDYLRLKDQIKEDTKHLKTLLKISENDFVNERYENADDVIVLDQDNDDEEDENSDNKSKSASSLMGNIAINSKRLFWIGKESIKTWSSVALKKIEAQLPAIKFNDIEVIDLTNGSSTSAVAVSSTGASATDNQNEANENSNDTCAKASGVINNNENDTDSSQMLLSFNEEIVCPHGLLSTKPNRRLVPQDAFKIFYSYFPNMRKFSFDDPECNKCKVNGLH